MHFACSSNELADATGSLDALLGDLGELLGANDARHGGQLALTQNLEEALLPNRTTLVSQSRLLFIKKQLTALVTSITAAFFSVEVLRASSDTRVHSLSRFTVEQ